MLITGKFPYLLYEDKDKRQEIAVLGTYIENNRDGVYDSRFLRDKVEDKSVLVCSSGAMEKNIDVVIDRKFKKHGMGWTKAGRIISSN